jgi:hypothetical protein
VADGFKLAVPHIKTCFCKDDELAFIVHDRTEFSGFDRTGRRNPRACAAWEVYRCNDTSCPAEMWVRWDTLSRFVTGAGAASENSGRSQGAS